MKNSESSSDSIEPSQVQPMAPKHTVGDSLLAVHHGLQRYVPRLYYILLHLLIPLCILLGMAFLFGWLLARSETDGEIETNDEALRATALAE